MRLAKRVGKSITAIGCALMLSVLTLQPLARAIEIEAEGVVVAVEGIPTLPDTVKSTQKVSSLTDDMRSEIIDKAITFYFPNLVGYSKTCATATLSAALKLYEKKVNGDIDGLQYFLKSVALSLRSLTASTGSQLYMQFMSGADTIMQLNSALADKGVVDGVIDWDQFASDTALTAVNKFIDPESGEEKTVESTPTAEDVTISSDIFKEYIEDQNTSPVPKNKDLFFNSYRTDTWLHSNYNYSMITLYQTADHKQFLQDLYLYPFYKSDDGTMYYTDYQYHVYWGDNDDNNSSYALHMDVYRYLDTLGWVLQTDKCILLYEVLDIDHKCEVVCLTPFTTSSPSLYLFDSLSEYSGFKWSSFRYVSGNCISYKYTADGVNFDCVGLGSFDVRYDKNSSDVSDIGWLCCEELITREYSNIDTSKIPDNYYVTISGDTIYDYSITNPDTGQSDIINNYVTNNYTYTTNNNYGGGDGGNGTGGSVDGSITVDGRVDVGGTVSVDVNVNVNGGAASVGGVDYGDINTDPLDDYLNTALDDSSGIRQFMGDFFGFMPAELVVLLGIGLTFVIIGRIMGR